jgi:hypothetical protein
MAPLGLDPDLLKTIGSFAGAGLGAFTGIYAKELLERTRLKGEELQTRWLPLLTAAEELEEKLHALALVYANPGEGTWNGERWNNRPLPRLARDFIELFLLEENVGQVNSFDGLRPSERRGNRDSVLRARERIHELNGATTAMYKTAVYLGYAQRLRRELAHGRSRARSTLQAESKLCLESVRRALHGDGNGMVDDLQDLLGESMWGPGGGVIGYHDFRERILSEIGWDQFTELFRFYIHFHMKLGYQVEATQQELRKFCAVLEKVVRIERQRFARLRSLGHAIAHTASKAWVRMHHASRSLWKRPKTGL